MKRRKFLTTMGIFGTGAAIGLGLKGRFKQAVEFALGHNPATRKRRAAVQVQGKSMPFSIQLKDRTLQYELRGISTKELLAGQPNMGYEKRWVLMREGKPALYITTGDLARPQNQRVFDITTPRGEKFGSIRDGEFRPHSKSSYLMSGELKGILSGISETERLPQGK